MKLCNLTHVVLAAALCMTGLARGQVIFTEIMHSPGGTDTLWEWVEIRNIGDSPVNLDGWVLDDDDSSNMNSANIVSNGGATNTLVPAGGVAVLYAGDSLNFMPERFHAAWGSNVALIGVSGLPTLTAGDAIGLWPNQEIYAADAISDAEASPYRRFANAVAAIDYSIGFPVAAAGRSIVWNGNGSPTSGANWVASQAGALNAYTSVETTIPNAQINSTEEWGNPGVRPAGSASAGLLITEIMYAPASPLVGVEYDEVDFEWVEIFNNTGAAINFVTRPHVFDDDDGSKLAAVNLRTGSLAAGEVGVLFNKDHFTAAEMRAMWGEDINFLPVENWPSLNNTGAGDAIAIWPSYSAYNTEAVTGPGRTHNNAIASQTYDTRASQGWPAVNNLSSIWLHNLTGDPNSGGNWTRAGAGSDSLSEHPAPIFELAIDHEGGDVGSPGFALGLVPSPTGDYNTDGIVDAADYVIWRKAGGTLMEYDVWRANFGRTLPGGGSNNSNQVPEPENTAIALAIAMSATAFNRRRWSRALRSPLRFARP